VDVDSGFAHLCVMFFVVCVLFPADLTQAKCVLVLPALDQLGIIHTQKKNITHKCVYTTDRWQGAI
jgi:hypothetical protein